MMPREKYFSAIRRAMICAAMLSGMFGNIFFCSGCATIARGGYESMLFTSEPQGAHVFLDSVPIGVTPFHFEVSRQSKHDIIFVKQHYLPKPLHLEMEYEWKWFWLDLFIWGWVIDLPTGAWYNWDYNFIYAALEQN